MKHFQIISQTCLLLLFSFSAHAESSCFELVKQLEKKKNIVDSNGGMWGYFEKTPELRTRSVDAIQLDSRINKIFFTLNHLCETEKGIPLNDLATYISSNLTAKSMCEFRSELILLGKTPQQIDTWFEFYQYAQNQKSRTLKFSKIRIAFDQSIPISKAYIQLANKISQGASSDATLENTQSLNISIDQLLSQQPYLAQALEEISHIPYWDINESTGGS